MPDSQDESPGDDYFNDLSQQPSGHTNGEGGEWRDSQGESGQVPKPKRIACVLCRKRKLRCDGIKPSCGTCTRLAHNCSYDEVRKKSGPKRGYVKALEARLAQLETRVKTQDESSVEKKKDGDSTNDGQAPDVANTALGSNNMNILQQLERAISQPEYPEQVQHPHMTLGAMGDGLDTNVDDAFPWEMMGLGLDEPLPTQDVIDELNQAYFEKIHPSLPMIHRPRYFAAMNLPPHMRPPICLRYAMWASAAAVTDKFESLAEHFYVRARKYIQQDEMKGHGESMISIAHCQTWTLLGTYEFKWMYFPRAWMSAGRASRLALMMGLHRIDGQGLDVKQCLPVARDWTEREERRRTFWMAFCIDRYSSIGTGWPMTIEERDILTRLPCDEESYELNKPAKTLKLSEALEPSGSSDLASFSGVVLLSALFGRNLLHLHRPGPDDQDDDLNGEFWRRHRSMDHILLNIALSLPDRLRLPSGLNSSNVVFLNMSIHTSTICLHQAAIFKADKNKMPPRVSAESKIRCITAAAEIASIMRQISHLNIAAMNPFISFCLYVAARVFVQYLKSRPSDVQIKASLRFLLSAMHAIKRKNPLTESFLVQLDVDLESAGLDDTRSLRTQIITNTLSSCPMDNIEPGSKRPAFGDNGLAMYNKPEHSPSGASGSPNQAGISNQNGAFGYSDLDRRARTQTENGTAAFNLPNRQRSPASNGVNCSPAALGTEMDLSPDGSGIDQRTPSSTTHNPSSHSSYSPQNPQTSSAMQTESDHLPNIFDPSFIPHDFDMQQAFSHATSAGQQGFGGWSGGGSGLTPAPSSGLTPVANASNGMNDVLGAMSDTDWGQMIDSLSTWDHGLTHDASLPDMMNRSSRVRYE